MISLGKNQNYIRFSPNPGFTFKVWVNRWIHYCNPCGVTLLKPGEVRRGAGRKVKVNA
ncbi:hypothetical protein LCGC14_2026580 [marine sediment metagenome]|uniref:Uncharacterized protein n=1 Tax=marine sediment metagenome TaxID=412755 RepID=A0A0F9HT21_9ZZZZ